jgi:hypothetical protein
MLKTLPQGLEGLLTMIAAVFSSIRDSIWCRSTSQPWSGRRLYSLVSIPENVRERKIIWNIILANQTAYVFLKFMYILYCPTYLPPSCCFNTILLFRCKDLYVAEFNKINQLYRTHSILLYLYYLCSWAH